MSALDMAGAIMRVVICSMLLLLSVGSTVTQGFEAVGVPPLHINRAHPLAQGLVGWWLVAPPLAGGGTWYNLVAPQHATLLGVTSGFGVQPTAHQPWWGDVRLDGSSTYALTPTTTAYDFLDQTFTVAVWYRATTAGYLVNKRFGTSGGWFLRLNADGTLAARILAGGGLAVAERGTTSTTHLDNTWRVATVVFHTDTVTIATNDLTIYINGILDQGTLFSNATDAAGACGCGLAFGAQTSADAGSFVTGRLDDIRVWNRGLGLQEIQAVATQPAPSFGGLLVPLELSPVALVTTVTPTGTLLPFFK